MRLSYSAIVPHATIEKWISEYKPPIAEAGMPEAITDEVIAGFGGIEGTKAKVAELEKSLISPKVRPQTKIDNRILITQLKERLAAAKAITPPVEVAPTAIPTEMPTTPSPLAPVKPRLGVRYVFNLRQFRFEPQSVELPVGVSPTVNKLINLVKSAKPAREITEGLKHEELVKRVGAAAASARATGATKAAYAAMAKLKGVLPEATFMPPEAGLTGTEIAELFNGIKNKILIQDENFFKWLNTDGALRKLLAGKIPQRAEIELLEDMFGSDLAGAILGKRPLSEKVWETTLDVLNIPRAILTSIDFSAWLRQGAFIVTAYPSIGAKALAVDIKAFFSGKYAAEIDKIISTGKFAQLRESAGLYLAPVGEGKAIRLAAREEAFMTRFAKQVPLLGQAIKWSERAYLSTLNYMRAKTFDKYAAQWEPMKYSMKTYKELATLINWATGRGPIGKLSNITPLLNSVFFATRLQTSRAAMLLGGYKFTSTPVRKAYARMMVRFFGITGGIVALLGLIGVVTVEKDPRSADFLKIRIGNTRLDPWAGFRPIATLIAQLITGERKTATGRIQEVSRVESLERFIRSKLSPAAGLAVDIKEGETYTGEALSLEAKGIGEQAYQRLCFLFVQDLIDAIR